MVTLCFIYLQIPTMSDQQNQSNATNAIAPTNGGDGNAANVAASAASVAGGSQTTPMGNAGESTMRGALDL